MPVAKTQTVEFTADITAEEVRVAIERKYSIGNLNIGKIQSIILKNGPQVFKFAVFREIIDQHTKEHHHNALTINSFKKLKVGWIRQAERTITFEDNDSDEIGLLETFIQNFHTYIQRERRTYNVIPSSDYEKFSTISQSEVDDTLSSILEDPDNYKRVIEEGGLILMKDVVEWVFQQQSREPIIEKLNSLSTETLQELATVAGISQINKILKIWEDNKFNDSEEFWQNMLTEYSWVLSQVFAAPTILYKEKAYVGGKTLDNKGGNLVDIIYKNRLSANIILIELKTPCTKILGNQYRQTYAMSNETSGAISQTLNYKHSIQQNYYSLQMADRPNIFEAISPRTLLILGNHEEEFKNDQGKIEAFELYRQNMKDVSILTYDELFAKVELLKSILQKGK